MLTAKITTSNGAGMYQEELVDFSWYMKVNESSSLQASVPTLVATLRLVTVDNVLRAARKNDKVEVYAETGLTLPMRITEVTVFERKKEVEIACAYANLGTARDVEGTIKIDTMTLSTFITHWSVAQLKAATDITKVNAFWANVRTKADLYMALAWSYDDRKVIALTPFASTYNYWQQKYEYIAMFSRQLPDGTESGVTPVYTVEAEDIIDYEITPADPPVTALKTTSLGQLAPTTQIPTFEVKIQGSGSLHTNMRTFFIEKLKFGAVYTCNYANLSYSEPKITWSDGLVSQLSGVANVFGIFSNAYVVAQSGNIVVYDRNTLTALQTFSGYTVNVNYGIPFVFYRAIGQTDIIDTDDVYAEVCWVSNVADSSSAVLAVVKKRIKATNAESYSLLTVNNTTGSSLVFGTTVKLGASSVTSQVSGLFYEAQSSLAKLAVFKVYASGTNILVSTGDSYSYTFDFSSYTSGTTYDGDLTISDALQETVNGTYIYLGLRVMTKTAPRTLVHKYIIKLEFEDGNFLDDTVLATDLYDSVSMATQGTVVVDSDNYYWAFFGDRDLVTKIQEGSLSTWFGGEVEGYYALRRGMFVYIEDLEGDVWRVYFQMSQLPFISRKYSEQYQLTTVAEGEDNVIDLPFEVGALDPVKKYVDTEVGRIEVSFAKFYVYDDNRGEYRERYVNELQNMAMGAYVKVSLDPDDITDFVIAKVVGFKITYSGLVEAKLYGIIVDV